MIYAVLNYPSKTFKRWINHLPDYYKPGYVLPQSIDVIPAYDSATQYIIPGIPIVEATQVRKTWTVVDKTTEELANETEEVWITNAKTTILGSAIWTSIKNDQDLTAGQIQTVIRFLARIIIKKVLS